MLTERVKNCRKSPGECQKCGVVIKVGEPYKSIKARYGPKNIRCDKCPDWRPSERTGSDKLSNLYGAREEVEDALAAWDSGGGDASDLRETLESAAETAETVGEEYREAAEAWEGKGPAEEWEEKAEQCDSWKDELESAAGDIEDFDEDAAKDEINGEKREPKPGTDQQLPESVGSDGSIAVESQANEDDVGEGELGKKREEWADEVRGRIQDAIDALEL